MKPPDVKLTDIHQTLASCELFKGFEQKAINMIAKICQVKTYKTADFVYQQGDFGEYLYIIAEGQVTLERTMNTGSREGRVVITILGKGRVFGCWSTILDEPHNMLLTTFCQKPAKIILLKGGDLRKLMIRDTQFGFNVLERLCFLLRDRVQAAYGAMEKI
ncbi:MAG: cyclic nucleotide-binding domain-containing protein [Desulfobacteraceae bacterium]|nr:cyclic nucleotide-binding domain-containing protein [Desulfobacteraceae bacterium]MBC2756145.1 cyclic nucleotide-binding domain-containing protein [Desulfobacteraceae bacterium]